ncbi:hypothetical protein J4G02_18530 [Candidatus Poribacteria bacterium]|nr:hypothetical protein [Candidatus Poribacteria bacterium]
MGPFAVELKLANSVDTALVHRGLLAPNQVRQTEIRGVVDTGAVRLVIPEHVATELGVREVDEIQVRLSPTEIRHSSEQLSSKNWISL